jgi:predicted RNA-binding protein YlqC (UPF0109 family)
MKNISVTCKELRTLVSYFVDNPESVDISHSENQNGAVVFTVHLMKSDLENVTGKNNSNINAISHLIKYSFNNQDTELKLDVINNKEKSN